MRPSRHVRTKKPFATHRMRVLGWLPAPSQPVYILRFTPEQRMYTDVNTHTRAQARNVLKSWVCGNLPIWMDNCNSPFDPLPGFEVR
jgi:hypothetical protein